MLPKGNATPRERHLNPEDEAMHLLVVLLSGPHVFSVLCVPAKEEFVGNGQKFFIGRCRLVRGVRLLLLSAIPSIRTSLRKAAI